jgi:hypothetical protein
MARRATNAEARLIHFDLAGRYSIIAAQSEMIPHLNVIDAPPMEAYASCLNLSAHRTRP